MMRGVERAGRGVVAAARAHPATLLAVAAGVLLLHILLPMIVLSAVRKPWTYFAFNPWLKSLPSYLVSPVPLADKLDFLGRVAVLWFSADGPYGAPEWGFAVDTMDLLRFLLMSLLVGTYFALWRFWREQQHTLAAPGALTRAGGVFGAFASALGLSTGPCSVMGCGAPVLPVVGLAFAGLSSGTLAALSQLSRVSGYAVLLIVAVGLVAMAGRVGADLDRTSR
jgi:hypothetical protein